MHTSYIDTKQEVNTTTISITSHNINTSQLHLSTYLSRILNMPLQNTIPYAHNTNLPHGNTALPVNNEDNGHNYHNTQSWCISIMAQAVDYVRIRGLGTGTVTNTRTHSHPTYPLDSNKQHVGYTTKQKHHTRHLPNKCHIKTF